MKKQIVYILLLVMSVFTSACTGKGKDESTASRMPAMETTATSASSSSSQATLESVMDVMAIRSNMNGSSSFSYASHVYTLPLPFQEIIPLLGKKDRSYVDDQNAFLRTLRQDTYQEIHMQDVDFAADDFSYEPKAEDVFLFTMNEFGSVAYIVGVRNEEDHVVTAAEMTVTDFYISTPFFYESVLLPGNIDPWIMKDGNMPITAAEWMEQWGKPEAAYDFSKSKAATGGSKISFRETDTMESFVKGMHLQGITLDYLVQNEDGTFTGTILECRNHEQERFDRAYISNLYFFSHGGKWYAKFRKENGQKIKF